MSLCPRGICFRASCGTRPNAPRTPGPIPAGITGRGIVRRQRVPLGPAQAIEVVDHLSVAQRHLAGQPLVASQAGAVHVEVAEATLLQPQHRHVGQRPDREVAEFLALDLPRRIPGRARDDVVDRQPEGQKLAHHVQHVFHAGVHASRVQVGRDGIGKEAFLDGRHRNAPDEAAAAMPDVEDHAALASLVKRRVQAAGRGVELRPQSGVHMRVDVAFSQLPRDRLGHGALGRCPAKIDHDRNLGDGARLDAPLDGRPLRPAVVGRLDPDDHVLVLERHLGRRLRLHVGEILLVLPAAHPVADDVQERQDARPRPVDDPVLEIREVTPPRAAGVHHGRDARPERESVRVDAVVARVGTSLARPGVHVNVDIDESRGDVKAGNVDDLERAGRLDLGLDRRDLPVLNGDVAHGADFVFGIDHVAAAQKQVILRLLCRRHGRQKYRQEQRRER